MKCLVVLAFFVAAPAFAQTTYDPSTGNFYYQAGNTTFGSNAATGSTWNSTTYGSQTFGTDSRGNSWNYNSQTGAYYNSGTGVTCYGKGVYRTCTK
jgi:hypothetical protein